MRKSPIAFAALLALAGGGAARAQEGEMAIVRIERGDPSATVTIGHGESGGLISASRGGDIEGRAVVIRQSAGEPSTLTYASAARGTRVGRATVTSGFGARRHPILGGGGFPSGVDLAAAAGTPIFSAREGVVQAAGWSRGYGLLVVLGHAGGVQSRFGHMSRIAVSVGQHVRRGDLVGFVGATGLATGPHLHYEVRHNGVALNPLPPRGGK